MRCYAVFRLSQTYFSCGAQEEKYRAGSLFCGESDVSKEQKEAKREAQGRVSVGGRQVKVSDDTGKDTEKKL